MVPKKKKQEQFFTWFKEEVQKELNKFWSLPVLQVHTKDKKLCFPLYMKCAERKKRKRNHKNRERCLTGTWTSVEIETALDAGYEIREIHSVLHYSESAKFCRDTNISLSCDLLVCNK